VRRGGRGIAIDEKPDTTRETEGREEASRPSLSQTTLRSRAPEKEKPMEWGKDYRDFDESDTRFVEVGAGITLRVVAPSLQEGDRDAAELEELCGVGGA